MSHLALRRLNAQHRLGIVDDFRVNHDLVINPVEPQEAAGRHLTNHGGPTLVKPQVSLLFLNNFWSDWQKLEQFTRDVVEGGYLKPLTDLGYGSGPGNFRGSYQLQPRNLPTELTSNEINDLILSIVTSGENGTPSPEHDSFYMLILPDGIHVKFDPQDGGSCQNWCGYHSNANLANGQFVAYSVQPATTCGACMGNFSSWDAFCMVMAHELAEAATDPTASTWYDNTDGSENADIVAWVGRQYGPYTVQGYFTNEHGNTLGDYTGPIVPSGNPQPQPQPQGKDRALALATEVIDAQSRIVNKIPARYTTKRKLATERLSGMSDVFTALRDRF